MIICKSQNKLSNNYDLKDSFPQLFILGGVGKFSCQLCNESGYREFIRHLALKDGAHFGI